MSPRTRCAFFPYEPIDAVGPAHQSRPAYVRRARGATAHNEAQACFPAMKICKAVLDARALRKEGLRVWRL